jgi:hypothetical protein
LKKLFDLLAFDGLALFWIGGIRIVCGHGNLVVDIVGEFVRYWIRNLTSASESVGTPLQSAGR